MKRGGRRLEEGKEGEGREERGGQRQKGGGGEASDEGEAGVSSWWWYQYCNNEITWVGHTRTRTSLTSQKTVGGSLNRNHHQVGFFPRQMGKDSTRIHHPLPLRRHNRTTLSWKHVLCDPYTAMPDSPSPYNPRDLHKQNVWWPIKTKTKPRSPLQGIPPPPDSPHRVDPLNMGTVLRESDPKE